jgi:hypothetical protein
LNIIRCPKFRDDDDDDDDESNGTHGVYVH